MEMYEGWQKDAREMTTAELRVNLRNSYLPREVNQFLAKLLLERENKNVKQNPSETA